MIKRKKSGYTPAAAGRKACNISKSYTAVYLFLALFILTMIGAGNAFTVSVLGIILCAEGFVRKEVEVDLWVLVPLIVYNLFSAVSSYMVYGNIAEGYVSTQMIYPLLYLLMACLDEEEKKLLKRLCVGWVGAIAIIGVVQFVLQSVTQGARRLSVILGNPNALGIFLVIGWFMLMAVLEAEMQGKAKDRQTDKFILLLSGLEPMIMIALALTLSMGSFAAMAGGILVILISKRMSFRQTLQYACRLLARAALGMGTGILLYLAADRTGMPWICIFLAVYAAALAMCWSTVDRFLRACPRVAASISATGFLVAAAAVTVRPSSLATFAERLEMMRNGMGYLAENPLLGVGPYQWRLLNLADGDKYFNTWHIHNVLIHVGVELGLVAMVMLVVVAVRYYRKSRQSIERGGFTAFLLHNLMDTSFFYMGVTALTLLTVGRPKEGGVKLSTVVSRLLFGAFAMFFAWELYLSLWPA